MTKEDEFKKMSSFEIKAMNLLLTTKASKTALTLDEFIQFARLQGASDESIELELLKDLEEGGRLFGEFRNSIKATTSGVIRRTRDSAQFAEDENVEQYMWVAVLSNTCPDCIARHGEIKTLEEWEAIGLPGAGFTVCKEHCQCILVDANKSVLKPIQRGKARTAQERVATV